MKLVLALTEKYHALMANPPYMGGKNMNAGIVQYAKIHYPDSKADLYSIFMEMMIDKTLQHGLTAFITMESWMFLSSFVDIRKKILKNVSIISLGHFGWYIIGIAFGTAMTVLRKIKPNIVLINPNL